MRRGLSVLDLLVSQAFQLAGLPDALTNALDQIAIEFDDEIETPQFRRWIGTLPAEAFLRSVLGVEKQGDEKDGSETPSTPKFIESLTWTLTVTRGETPDGEPLENPPGDWDLTVDLRGLRLELPEAWGIPLLPAQEIPAQGTDVRRLRALEGDTRSALVGNLIFRIASQDGRLSAGLTGPGDVFAPASTAGLIAQAQLDPPAAVFSKDDGFGIVLDTIEVDQSKRTTPATIGRGDPEWTGFRLTQAAIYLPHGVPLVRNLSIETRDLLIPTGDTPGSLQGEFSVETGRISGRGDTLTLTQDDRSQALHWSGSSNYLGYYKRSIEDGVSQPVTVTLSAPTDEGTWIILEAGQTRPRSEKGETTGPILIDESAEVRYTRQDEPDTGADFKLLQRKPDAPKTARYPQPDQVIRFTPFGPLPEALFQIDVRVNADDNNPAGVDDFKNVLHISGSPDDLTKLRFFLKAARGGTTTAATDQTPRDVSWAVYPETRDDKGPQCPLFRQDDALARHDDGGYFTWDGWKNDQPVFVIAEFTPPNAKEDLFPRRITQRLYVTPRADTALLISLNNSRHADTSLPRIVQQQADKSFVTLGDDAFANAGWATFPLDNTQTTPTMLTGRERPIVRVQTTGPENTLDIAEGFALLVPVAQAPIVETNPRYGPNEFVTSKRVATMYYDRPYFQALLGEGPIPPEGGTTDSWAATVAKRWLNTGAHWFFSAAKPDDTTRKTLLKAVDAALTPSVAAGDEKILAEALAEHVRSLGLTKDIELYVVAHTSPEGKAELNKKLAEGPRLEAGLRVANQVKSLLTGAHNVTIAARAEHQPRSTDEPDYAQGRTDVPVSISDPAKKVAGPDAPWVEQRTWPHTFARQGQLGDEDTGP
ncbi:MAG: hypothetical protein AAF862_04440, partial [Pseudomonadota bacterium]